MSEAAGGDSELPAKPADGWCALTGGAGCSTGNEGVEACAAAAAGSAGADDTPGVEAVGVSAPVRQCRGRLNTRFGSSKGLWFLIVMTKVSNRGHAYMKSEQQQ